MENGTINGAHSRSAQVTEGEALRIGILFGGFSREREISFAGGRTVFDLLDRRFFAPIPIFIDSFRRFIRLRPSLLYKGAIRDFFPSPTDLPSFQTPFQPYVENLSAPPDVSPEIGVVLSPDELRASIDFAFLTLHGPGGEDGSIQGFLEWLGVPYSGAGVLGSARGLNKILQREAMERGGFAAPRYTRVRADEPYDEDLIEGVTTDVGFPCVVKNPTQGSSVGVRVCRSSAELFAALDAAFLRKRVRAEVWRPKTEPEKQAELSRLADIRYDVGFPLIRLETNQTFLDPDALYAALTDFAGETILQAFDSPEEVLVEAFIDGREFSIIVVEDEDGAPFPLPPTEILKNDALYDYRSKYLPGGAHKKTPMPLDSTLERLLSFSAGNVKRFLNIDVYARIDGFLTEEGELFFNDPNTTSGMTPSSFFFHQAAELGLSPAEFLTYIISASLRNRKSTIPYAETLQNRLKFLQNTPLENNPLRIGVILGGYSFERHVSVESGRNVYEKLNASPEYAPIPYFLLDNALLSDDLRTKIGFLAEEAPFSLWEIPIAVLLKDNADDIAEKIIESITNPPGEATLKALRQKRARLLGAATEDKRWTPRYVSFKAFQTNVDFAFIALHGRPGEDGVLQRLLEKYEIPFNGSGPEATEKTIDKYVSNEILKAAGFCVPEHFRLSSAYLRENPTIISEIVVKLGLPLVAKPIDDGCSAAVKILKDEDEIAAYCALLFREAPELNPVYAERLKISPQEEIPQKNEILFEKKISVRPNHRLMEVTVGFYTETDENGALIYRVFPPSETLTAGEILTLEEKFLAGEGQNVTPARFDAHPARSAQIAQAVCEKIATAARALGMEGYGRIDAFVHIPAAEAPEVELIEANALPGLTPATCIFHQAALENLSPFDFIEKIIQYGLKNKKRS